LHCVEIKATIFVMAIDIGKFLRNLWFDFMDPVVTVCNLIYEWQPTDISSEIKIEESLYKYLAKELNRYDVRRQFRHDRITADILINEKLAIEIKLNLTRTEDFRRLIGQLDCYANWGVRMIVLLVGKVDADLMRRVEERLQKDWEDEYEARVIHMPL
jgi:hypothetical protein